MKAITLWQPWATLIAIGVKPFETRSWPTRYRGPIAIHAGKTREGLRLCEGEIDIEQALALAGYILNTVPLGVVVCTANLVDVLSTDEIAKQGSTDPFGDYSSSRFAWHLVDIQPLDPPVPAAGKQGLWEWAP
jgi:hypothetical protein